MLALMLKATVGELAPTSPPDELLAESIDLRKG